MQHQTFELQLKVYNLLWNIVQDVLKHFRKQPKTVESEKLRTKANNHRSKLARTNNIMKKRKNIETRGFDTNAYVSHKQSLNKKQAEKIIELMTENKNKDGPEAAPDPDDIYTTAYKEHLEELQSTQEYFTNFPRENWTSEELEILFLTIGNFDRDIRTHDTLKKRQNIDTRGYDTNATITRHEYRQHEAAIEQETAAEEETAPIMEHLHPKMQEYEQNLPEPDNNIRLMTSTPDLKQPTPIIQYHPKGFRPYGQMQDVFNSHAPVKIVGGTYDAGKTYSCVAYIDHLARNYPGARLTFIHRYQNRIFHNIIPTYEKYLGFKPTSVDHPTPTPIAKYGGEIPIFYEYWNGSRIYMNGLDKPQNLLSDFFDAAFVNQAELLTFDRWDELTARVSERAGVLPIAFLLGDCNPSTPNHWIRQQTKAGKIEYYEMTFRDNPEIYDPETGEITARGQRRVEKLENLEGMRYKRGYEGVWASNEGLVFDTFQTDKHIIDNFKIPKKWTRYLSIDWGFRNAASCIWWARDKDKRLYAYKEIYKTHLTVPDFIELIKKNCTDKESFRYVSVDNANQDAIQQLRDAGFRIQQPKKSRVAQIDIIKQRLKIDKTGNPSIAFFRDRLVHDPDPSLQEEYRPTDVVDEFLTCTYDAKITGTGKDDEAIKGDHHGIDGTAYLLLSQKQNSTVGTGKHICFAVGIPKERWDPDKHIGGIDPEEFEKKLNERKKNEKNKTEYVRTVLPGLGRR